MELSNLDTLPNKTIVKHLGLVQGSTVRSKHAGKEREHHGSIPSSANAARISAAVRSVSWRWG